MRPRLRAASLTGFQQRSYWARLNAFETVAPFAVAVIIARSHDVHQAVTQTLTTAGRAMLFTTLILSATFFTLVTAELKSTANFGLIAGFTICMALLADFLLAPALMAIFVKERNIKETTTT